MAKGYRIAKNFRQLQIGFCLFFSRARASTRRDATMIRWYDKEG